MPAGGAARSCTAASTMGACSRVPDAAGMGIVDAGMAGEGRLDTSEAAAAVVGQAGLAEAAYDQDVAVPPKMDGEVVGGKPGDVVQTKRRDGQGMRNCRFAQVDNWEASLKDGQRQLFGPTPVDHGVEFEGQEFLDDGELGSRPLGVAGYTGVDRDKLEPQAPGGLVNGILYLQPEGIVAGVAEADNQVTGHGGRIGPNEISVNRQGAARDASGGLAPPFASSQAGQRAPGNLDDIARLKLARHFAQKTCPLLAVGAGQHLHAVGGNILDDAFEAVVGEKADIERAGAIAGIEQLHFARLFRNPGNPPANEHEISLSWRQRNGIPVDNVEVTACGDQHVACVNVGVAEHKLLGQFLRHPR